MSQSMFRILINPFYETIGFTLQQCWSNHYAQLVANGINIGLHPNSGASNQRKSIYIYLGFTILNFVKSKEELIK